MALVTSHDSAKIVWDFGVHIDSTLVWLDPKRPRDFAIVTNARAYLGDRQRKLLLGDRTARLCSAVAGRRVPGLVTPFGRTVSLGNLRLELYPSGYLPGAASVLITLPSGVRVAYSGAFSPGPSRTAEPMEVRHSDVLILDANYGAPRYRFSPPASVEEEVLAWVEATLSDGQTPVLLAACPGKAQDLMALCAGAGHPIRAHRTIHAWAKAYRSIGIDLPGCTQFRGHPAAGEILFWPSHLRRSTAIRNLRRARFAAATGSAIDAGAEKRLKVNRVFPLSARADFDALVAYAKQSRASDIVTVGRHAVELADALNTGSVRARPLRETPQLDLL